MIIANVNDQTLTLRYEGVVSDSVRFLKVKFNFNNTWDDKAKVAVFKYDSHEYMVIFTDGNSMYLGDNICFVPQEVIKYPGFSVSAYGTKNQSVITTNEATVDVENSGYGDILPAEPTPSVWNQLLTACQVRQLPAGGLTGYVLQKASDSDDDVKWDEIDAYSRAEAVSTFVTKSTTVNGKTLNHNISINCADVGAYPYPETGIPKYDLSATVKASLSKADTALQAETDPTVPSWAKQPSKPTYTAQEVGALPNNTFIPTKTSDLTNDSGFLTAHQDISGKQDKLTAGKNITIGANNVISAGRKWEPIINFTLTEEVQQIDFTVDDNNQPFNLSEIYYRYTVKTSPDHTIYPNILGYRNRNGYGSKDRVITATPWNSIPKGNGERIQAGLVLKASGFVINICSDFLSSPECQNSMKYGSVTMPYNGGEVYTKANIQKITLLDSSSAGGITLLPGLKFELYGVRA